MAIRRTKIVKNENCKSVESYYTPQVCDGKLNGVQKHIHFAKMFHKFDNSCNNILIPLRSIVTDNIFDKNIESKIHQRRVPFFLRFSEATMYHIYTSPQQRV